MTSDNSLNLDNGSAWLKTITPTGAYATGNIPYYNAGWIQLSPGAQYYALVSNGTSSAPTYQQVGLTNGVTGTLPVVNGGSGVASSTGTVNVVLSNSPTLVSPLLGTPTSGVMTNVTGLPLTTGVTGTLPIANGGTGVTSLTNLDLSVPPAIGATTPNTGKFSTLTATGAATFSSTVNIGTTNQGDVFYDNGTNVVRLTPGSANQVLNTRGASANPVWGSAFVPGNMQVFTTTGTWTKPSAVSNVYVKVIGAGGNGGIGVVGAGGGGGGGGGYAEGIIAVTGNVTVTIGATNSFAGTTTIQATAGSTGTAGSGTTAGAGGAGGIGSNGTINLTGAIGCTGTTAGSSSNTGGMGGSSAMGGGGGGSTLPNSVGAIGGQYGGGGGGAGGAISTGGVGNAGAVIVYY